MTLTKRKSGFTLVELLIVIGIIAVLAAIAIPAVAGIIERTGRTRDNSNASNMSNAIEQWSLEYPLFYNDYQSGTDTDDEVGSRVRSAIKNMGYISNIEHSKLRGFAGKVVHKETFYPKGDDNELIAMRVIGILKTYLKSNNDILTPYQSDCAFWYLTDTSVIICGPFDASQAELFALAGDKGSENPSGTWINLTDYGNEATKGDAILTLGVQGMGGEISGNGTYKVGDYVKISAGASSEEFKGWYDDAGVLITTDMEHSFVIVENTALVARYGNGCQLVLTASGPGTVSGGGQYATNSSVTVNATPTGASSFDGWFDNGVLVSTSTSYTFNINTDVNLTAKFTNIAYNVTLNSDGQGLTAGGGQYTNGTNVTVSATPSAGYKFVGWYKGSSKVSDNASYTFTMSGAVTLTAKFEAVTYTITAEVTLVKGDISLDKNKMNNPPTIFGVGTYSHGQQYTISVTCDENWVVTKITNGSATVSTNSSFITTASANVNYIIYCEYQNEIDDIIIPTGCSYYSATSDTTYPEHSYWKDIPTIGYGDKYSTLDYDYTYNDYNYWCEIGWNVLLKDESKNKTSVEALLETINNKSIIGIESCFMDSAITTAPKLPNTIKYMHSAFYNCDGLTDLPNLPTQVIDLYQSFFDCDNLTNVDVEIPSTTYYIASMFSNCDDIITANITGGANVQYTDFLFSNSTNLEAVILNVGQGVNTFHTETFYNCTSLENVTGNFLSGGDNSYSLFMNCSSLTDMRHFNIPSDSNGAYMFYGCTNLMYAPDLSNIHSAEYVFYNCNSLLHDETNPLKINLNNTSSGNIKYVFQGVSVPVCVYSANATTMSTNEMALLTTFTNITLAVHETNITWPSGYTSGSSALSSVVPSYISNKYSFTPTISGNWSITNYNIAAMNHSAETITMYCNYCGCCSIEVPNTFGFKDVYFDSYGVLYANGSRIDYDDDGSSDYSDEYEEHTTAFCDGCCQAETDFYAWGMSDPGHYYTFDISNSLTSGTTYDIYVYPYSSSYNKVYDTYILIKYNG